eukprot:TRINITY_DN9050_c2_g1_i1.p1 TRINITY_DN9050_c2_g1~~TRINITY_DN9050_c2_g1_i1.p1  ORF type:complete len:170 (-),score=43.33 TRINITY_DN9050_c2_g1_i1:204-713(-)
MAGTSVGGFSFGVLADVQYADKEDKESEAGVARPHRRRRYRAALAKLQDTLQSFAAYKRESAGASLDMLIHMGDIVDGNGDQSEAELLRVLDVIGRHCRGHGIGTISDTVGEQQQGESKPPHFLHVVGNHCLRVARPRLLSLLNFTSSLAYYRVPLPPHLPWDLLVLVL